MNKPDEAREQAAWSQGFRSAGIPESTASCPSAEILCDAVGAKLDAAEVRAVIEHCAKCSHCAEDWRVARVMAETLGDEAPAPIVESVLSIHALRKRWKHWGAGFGLCAVAAVTLLVLWPRNEKLEPTMRGDVDLPAMTSENYRFDGTTFYWPQFDEAFRYELLLTDMKFATIATVDGIEETQFALSDELRLRLEAVSEFYWQIRVWKGDGKSHLSPPVHEHGFQK